MNDRIRLAEAMGWFKDYDDPNVWHELGDNPDGPCKVLPDPENDANDDYAVLEWMRKDITTKEFNEFRVMTEWPVYRYQIGDYARAALKVLS